MSDHAKIPPLVPSLLRAIGEPEVLGSGYIQARVTCSARARIFDPGPPEIQQD